MTDTEAASTTQTAAVAEQGADVASEKAFSKKDATQKKGAPKGRKGSSKAREAMMADGVITPDMKKAKIAKVKATAKSTAAPKAKQPEKAAKPAKPAAEASEGSKKSIILGLLRRKDGATLAELAEASSWQNHSVRGFLSGTVWKKMGLAIESFKNKAGERTYQTTKCSLQPEHKRRPGRKNLRRRFSVYPVASWPH